MSALEVSILVIRRYSLQTSCFNLILIPVQAPKGDTLEPLSRTAILKGSAGSCLNSRWAQHSSKRQTHFLRVDCWWWTGGPDGLEYLSESRYLVTSVTGAGSGGNPVNRVPS